MPYLMMPPGGMKLVPRGSHRRGYSFRASFAFGRSSLLLHFRQRVARIAFRV